MVAHVAATVLLLACSAFFSGTETAILSLSTIEKDRLLRHAHGAGKRFFFIAFENPDEVLITILTGNMVVNIMLTAISEALGAEVFSTASELLSIAAVTIILIYVGELTPKNIAVHHAASFSYVASVPLSYLHTALQPLSIGMSRIRNVALSFFEHTNVDEAAVRESAVMSAIKMGYRSGTLEETELQLLETYFQMRSKCAHDVMVPRIEIPAIDASTPEAELIKRVSEHDGRYHLVYKDNIDHVLGYIDRIDLLRFRMEGSPFHLRAIQREPAVIYEKKSLSEVIALFNDKQAEILLVIDEYGGTAGIITHRTLIEMLFEDFFPDDDRGVNEPDSSGTYEVRGNTEIEQLCEVLDVAIESGARTVGGLVIELLDEIPTIGQTVEVEGLHITVQKVEQNRIVSVKIAKARG